ncbi:MAG: 4Fe-4S binding protein [Deltaproteobacteria bacterium]|nr:4Fe-4S binding protein [Deltaproteobacteria bacterium]
MSIRIDAGACTGCGRCAEICPGALLRLDEAGRAECRYPGDCWSCAACVKACGRGAIALYRAPELGGLGATLRVKKRGEALAWEFTLPGGAVYVINSQPGNAGEY